MKLFITLLFTTLSYSQEGIVVTGGDNENVSYTIGAGLAELQIPVIQEVTLGGPKFEVPKQPEPKPVAKKKTFFEKLIDAIKKLFK